MNVTHALRCGLATLLCGLAVLVGCSPPVGNGEADPEPPGIVKDRASFIPSYEYGPIGDKVVGVLQLDVQAVMANDGTGGPPDMLGFSTGGKSYRCLYAKDGLEVANADDAKR